MAEVALPQLGETVTEGTITRWFKQVGDSVAIDEMLYEVSTDKVDSEVPSPVAGVVTEIMVAEGETVEVGTVLAVVAGAAADGEGAPRPAPEPISAPPSAPDLPQVEQPLPPVGQDSQSADPQPPAEPATAQEPDGRLLSPVVRRLVREHGLDPDAITGTGVGGRITRNDVLDLLDDLRQAEGSVTAPPVTPAPEPAVPPSVPAPSAPTLPVRSPAPAGLPSLPEGSDFVPFNNIRRRTAEHMVHSVTVAPHALTVMEVDYENVEQVRQRHKDAWKAHEGSSLTYLPFVMRAVVDALADWPHMNASVEGQGLRLHRDRNIGVAVDLDLEGLIVPVVHRADGLRMVALARSVNDLAERARVRRLGADDISGGTFTISNNGSFGTYTTAAIINQPQVAVLSTDGVSRRPVVATDRFGNETIVVHSVGHLALAWDHRAFDGSYAAGFLRQVKDILETRDWESEF